VLPNWLSGNGPGGYVDAVSELQKIAGFDGKRINADGTDWRYREFCHAHLDGDCAWKGCPQIRDGEPVATGRHCPLDTADDEA